MPTPQLFENLVGDREYARRNTQAECLRSLQIDDKFKLARLHDRQVSGLFALENPAGVDASLPISIGPACTVAHQTASRDELTGLINHRHCLSGCQPYELFGPAIEKFASSDNERAGSKFGQLCKR